MPLSSLQAAIAALVVAVGNAVVALQFIGSNQATLIETAIVGVLAALFPLANAIIHTGVTAAKGKDASQR
jgi:hypothetical protein